MSSLTIVVPPTIRSYVGGASRVPVEASTVKEALNALAGGSEELHKQLFDSRNEIHRFVRVFVNGRPAAIGGEENVADGSEVTIVLALAGG